jgi:hypothetical protein
VSSKLDVARDLLDPEAFVAPGVYEDGAALERQESASTPFTHLLHSIRARPAMLVAGGPT